MVKMIASLTSAMGGQLVWILAAVLVVVIALADVVLWRVTRNKNNDESSEQAEEQAVQEESAAEESAAQPVEEEAQPAEGKTEESAEPAKDEPVAAAVSDEVSLRKSFTARLSQSDDKVKETYSSLKNNILSYDGVTSRVSWNFDSFILERASCIKLQLRGKTLNMFIALDPNELESKYRAVDVSDKKRYEGTATNVKIKGTRSLAYAKQLVAKLMKERNVKRHKLEDIDYKVPYQTDQELIDAGLIKVGEKSNNFPRRK